MYLAAPLLQFSAILSWFRSPHTLRLRLPLVEFAVDVPWSAPPVDIPSPPVDVPAIRPQPVNRWLFGGPVPWNTSSVIWTAVDDRVRGGSSQSYLEPDIFWGAPVAKFHGILDDDTLGGAGFASQSTRAVSVNGSLEEPVWDLSNCTGILMTFYSAQPGKTYTLTLHDELESGLSWETSFWLNIPYNGKVVHEVTWKNFKPFYRGREVSRSPPLRTENIRRFSLMMRSFFAKQHGEFELGIDIITARC